MQVKVLGSERQMGLKENVVNIENDLDICAQVLLRRFDETSTVQVKLMRRMNDKTPYMYEVVRPSKVYKAAKFLVQQPAYINQSVQLSNDWRGFDDGK